MILLPISSENKTVLLIPWDNYRTSLILRTTVCFTIAVLTCLGSIALMSYAIINGNWVFFGMSLGIILLLISVALILDLPVKNKFFGTTLTNEISQDISNVGVESIEKCRVAFANIRNTFIPNMRDLHNKLLNDYDTVISNKEEQIRNLSSSLESLVHDKQQELSIWIERNPQAYQTQTLREQLDRWNSYEQKGTPVRNKIPSC
ncbi:hypothetical protein [Chlamydia psittaci]|uniref:hypothetical protein n=1 Tax=Chlamydia psittaci TaxID=83554 RepID=UPI00027E4AD4|nr:hypothetical protein [Chlamydia psittaci]AFS27902.1 putative inner membrane protein [Chlamydia psittaci NJ1]KPZ38099.1 membrane protein [Chlamydia psittaci NJ1]MDS0919932.1 hypothetical protein [Chlamydia psittaci]MDS0990161.1 hypothetical protein [Chlamydia psittaci]MDS0996134.1 hypothetical protein [Chlamydia psittaci]